MSNNNSSAAIEQNGLLYDGLPCPICNNKMEQIDTTYSNVDTSRSNVGQHTGDIYECHICNRLFIDNMLNGRVEDWSY